MTSERGSLRVARRWACACLVAVVTGCAAAPPADDASREYLDEETAATITVGGRPLVFARERPELAVHARDYLTLVPVDVNRAGTHAQYFYGYVWSTIDKRGVEAGGQAPARFELIADGRRIPLVPLSGEPRSLGLGEAPLPPPAASAQVLVSATTREVQRFVRDAAEIVAVAFRDGAAEPFPLWAR